MQTTLFLSEISVHFLKHIYSLMSRVAIFSGTTELLPLLYKDSVQLYISFVVLYNANFKSSLLIGELPLKRAENPDVSSSL